MKNNAKTPKRTRKCVVCDQPFNRREAVCWRCSSCQACKELTNDKYGNYCMHCHNYIDQARYGNHAITHNVHHNPRKSILN